MVCTRERSLFYPAGGNARPAKVEVPSERSKGQAHDSGPSHAPGGAKGVRHWKTSARRPKGEPLFGDVAWQKRKHLLMLHRVPDALTGLDVLSGEQHIMSLNDVLELGGSSPE
eukprot:TRINITY_DN10536_c0_g3_i2.p2 TRINITY_DN10536_c0_g3~~TRINITY_DN10536_c0_g3_i2.p2  ORF type:complete len:113 (-),score=5.04 TRINITY_DN10536_c0_g3_i2:160-498(-)